MSVTAENNDLVPMVSDSAPSTQLIVHAGTPRETPIPLRRVVSVIGSRGGCKVTLQHPKVSPVHVAIINDGVRVIAVDLVTCAGTLLNDLKLEHETLGDGDVLAVRRWAFTLAIQPPKLDSDTDAANLALDMESTQLVLEHLESGRTLTPARDVCIVGRRHGCDIEIDDASVSRAHALLFNHCGQPVLFDLFTPSRTLVNDTPIRFCKLRDADIISIGGSTFRVRLAGSSAATKPSNSNGTNNAQTLLLTPEDHGGDMIDIAETEGAQRWRIAEKFEQRAARKSAG